MIDAEQKNGEVVESGSSSSNDSEMRSQEADINKTGNGVLNGENKASCPPSSAKEDDQTPATSNGNPVASPTPKDKEEEQPVEAAEKVECIELDDDEDDDVIPVEEPPAKRSKVRSKPPSPVPEDPKISSNKDANSTPVSKPGSVKSFNGKKEPELTSYSALLDRLEIYVKTAIEKSQDVDRKVLDALLAAINILVKKEPYSVRKLILDKQLVLPNTISFPPSQVVELLIEHDPDFQLSRVIAKMFGNEQIKLSDTERRERQQLKATCPAPNMTGILMNIGQDLVQESTYSDIVHARNLPEVPKNMETYKQVAAQLKPVWEALKSKNEPFKLQVMTCQVSYCGFKTDSKTVMLMHRQTPHFCGRKFQCAMCNEFDTNENRINRHYLEVHEVKAMPRDDYVAKVQCPICDDDFNFKGQRDAHLKMCKRDIHKIRTLQSSRAPEHTGMVNRWLWDKPPVDPAILAQQQDILKANQAKQQQLLQLQQQRQYAAALAARQSVGSLHGRPVQNMKGGNSNSFSPNNRSQQAGQLSQMLKNTNGGGTPSTFTPQMIQAAMQQQLRQQQMAQQAMAAKQAGLKASAASALQKQMPPKERPTTQFKNSLASNFSTMPASPTPNGPICEICDLQVKTKEQYLSHLKELHQQLKGKTHADMVQGAPLACSRCRDRFWTYEGLERHLVMGHGLVTSDLLTKAQKKEDGGKCKLCGKQYAFNMLQHLVSDHQVKLCSAEIMYSCDVCEFKCSSYQLLESHLTDVHPKQISVPIR